MEGHLAPMVYRLEKRLDLERKVQIRARRLVLRCRVLFQNNFRDKKVLSLFRTAIYPNCGSKGAIREINDVVHF